MDKIKRFIKKAIQFLLNPRLILCFGIAWIFTNGWSYIMMLLGTLLKVRWMQAIAGGYLTFLWLPISPEKIATVAIAIWLLKWLFPNDQKTLAVLISLKNKIKMKHNEHKKKKSEDGD